MTLKKQRTKLARSLRRQGFKGATAFKLARVIVRAGCPQTVSAGAYAPFGVVVQAGGFVASQHQPTAVVGPQGQCVVTAWKTR